ncbi:molecular chaperone DnaJ [Mycobacteroides abscessus]|uniref:molecular chaperone DnaJ n=2 Tax=Mycobacteriaceae TaxID=1762 RepID=UPI001F1DB6F9|nr:molecular chaperone DnaJ [Mycobacteroides abscessus]
MKLRPLENWPGTFPSLHIRSPFSAPLRTTLEELDRELSFLGSDGSNAPSVLELALREGDFRIDGLPRADARVQHPGVILRIESRFGPLSYPAAKFATWQDNLRAITLGLNGLRRLDRYGITPGSEQYTGWKQLPPAGRSSVTTPSADDAEKFLRDLTGNYDAPLDKVYRTSRREMHPDRHDNDQEMWDRVEAAGDVLRRAGRLA